MGTVNNEEFLKKENKHFSDQAKDFFAICHLHVFIFFGGGSGYTLHINQFYAFFPPSTYIVTKIKFSLHRITELKIS